MDFVTKRPLAMVSEMRAVLATTVPRAAAALPAAAGSRRETYNFHFYPWDTKLPEIDARGLGGILTSFQDLANALGQYCKGDVTLKGAIPADILEATKFRATQIFEGNHGVGQT